MRESLDASLEAAHRHHARRLILILAVLLLIVAGCDSNEGGKATGGTGGGIDVTLQEFAVLAKPNSAPAGEITFSVTNKGSEDTHEFLVFKTDLAPDALPTAPDGSVDEEGEGIELVSEVEDIAVGRMPGVFCLARRGQVRPHLQHRREGGRRDHRPLPGGDADGLTVE
jgi:hypothetical protein